MVGILEVKKERKKIDVNIDSNERKKKIYENIERKESMNKWRKTTYENEEGRKEGIMEVKREINVNFESRKLMRAWKGGEKSDANIKRKEWTKK